MASDSSDTQTRSIIRRVLLGQLLFSAGHALTTGGFLNYFANPFFKGFAVAFSVFQVTPEAAESLAIVTRWVVQHWGGRKQVWWVSLLAARIAALGIPGLVYAGMVPGAPGTIPAILVLLALWYLFQGISYTAYLSWLSDLVPEVQWGKMLGRQSIAMSVAKVGMIYIAAAIFDRTKSWPAIEKLQAYVLLFSLGGGLSLASILPLIGVGGGQGPRTESRGPEEAEEATRDKGGAGDQRTDFNGSPSNIPVAQRLTLNAQRSSLLSTLTLAFSDPLFRRFLLGCWQLSFFQGLTQTVQYQFSANLLKVSQFEYYKMLSVMLLLQIPLAMIGGWLVDRGQDRKVMVGGLVALSLAMGCWWMATWYGAAWLMAAYVVWGLFGMVNVALPSLGLKLAPRSDNSVQLSLFRQIGGLLAALSGMLGGLLLDHISPKGALPSLEVFRWFFLISGIGRATAALWFWRTKPLPTEPS